MLFFRSTRFGQVAVLAEEVRQRDLLVRRACSDWYGGRRTTTTSPLRFGCSESEPSTFRSSSLFMIRRTTCLPGFAGSVSVWNALRTAVRTSSYVGMPGCAVLSRSGLT